MTESFPRLEVIGESSEKNKPPKFNDEGKYVVVDAETGDTLKGTFYVDTRVVTDLNKGSWETYIKTMPERAIVSISEDIPISGLNIGDYYSLWHKSADPEGIEAKKFHDYAVSLLKQGIPTEKIDERLSLLNKAIQDKFL